MKFVVKNTTKCGVLDLFCPHSCRGCGQLGSVLCECCKKNIISPKRAICPICKREIEDENATLGRCMDCVSAFDAMFVGGWREGVLGKIVEEYKFQSVWALGDVLAEVLDGALPKPADDFWERMECEEVVVVPLPTIGRHVRERGLDHTLRVVRKLAKCRGWKCEQVLSRAVDTVQVGAKAGERQEQARKAYAMRGRVNEEKLYILLDDVWTTGASMLAAADVMRKAGAKKLVGIVVAVGKPRE